MPKRTCSIDGCDRAASSRGWCGMHYHRWQRHGDPTVVIEQLPSLVITVCSIDGCEKPAKGRGWCDMHYSRWRNHGDPNIGARHTSTPEEFWALVDSSAGPDACWPWTGKFWDRKQTYGRFWLFGHDDRSHRWAWQLTHGEIVGGLLVCHTCDNPPCCNPAHLFLGTHIENMHDRDEKGRNKARTLAGGSHKLSEAQAAEIRQRWTGGFSTGALAAEFGVSGQMVWRLGTGRA